MCLRQMKSAMISFVFFALIDTIMYLKENIFLFISVTFLLLKIYNYKCTFG